MPPSCEGVRVHELYARFRSAWRRRPRSSPQGASAEDPSFSPESGGPSGGRERRPRGPERVRRSPSSTRSRPGWRGPTGVCKRSGPRGGRGGARPRGSRAATRLRSREPRVGGGESRRPAPASLRGGRARPDRNPPRRPVSRRGADGTRRLRACRATRRSWSRSWRPERVSRGLLAELERRRAERGSRRRRQAAGTRSPPPRRAGHLPSRPAGGQKA